MTDTKLSTCDHADDECFGKVLGGFCERHTEWDTPVDPGWHPADDPRHLTSDRF